MYYYCFKERFLFKKNLSIFFSLIFLFGCSANQVDRGVLSKEQVLKADKNADIFEFDEGIYKYGIDWVNKEKLTKSEELGSIKEDMATKLPIGAKIYSVKEHNVILLVEYDNTSKAYLLMTGE